MHDNNTEAATPQANNDFIREFLAEQGIAPNSPIKTAAAVDAEAEAPEVDTAEAEPEAEATEAVEADSEDSAEPEVISTKFDAKALAAAIDKDDPVAFLEALGDSANTLLGAKGHKALRLQAAEVKKSQKKNKDLESALLTKFGDPVAAHKAAASGNIDAFVEAVERQFGDSWENCIKAVNAAFAGKPSRIEAKAKQEKAAQTQAEASKKAAEAKVREHITATISKDKADAKLLKDYPKVADLVFVKLQSGFKNGITTPEKALKAVKADLAAEAKTLAKLFAKAEQKKGTNVRPPSEDRNPKGRPMTDAEFRESFLREVGLWK